MKIKNLHIIFCISHYFIFMFNKIFMNSQTKSYVQRTLENERPITAGNGLLLICIKWLLPLFCLGKEEKYG